MTFWIHNNKEKRLYSLDGALVIDTLEDRWAGRQAVELQLELVLHCIRIPFAYLSLGIHIHA